MGISRKDQLTANQLIMIRKLYNERGWQQWRIAAKFGCNQSHVSRILSGKACSFICLLEKKYKVLMGNIVPSKYEPIQGKVLRAKRSKLVCTKLTWHKVCQIRKQYYAGKATQMELAVKYNMNQTTIHRIVIGHTWKINK